MLLLLSLLQGITMSQILHNIPLEDLVSRSQTIALVRPTGSTGSREAGGMPERCVVAWKEYEVVEVLRAPSGVRWPAKIQVEGSDARYFCRIGAMMNSPNHPILRVDAYAPLDTSGLGDPTAPRVLFLRGEKPGDLAETVQNAQEGKVALPRIRELLAKP